MVTDFDVAMQDPNLAVSEAIALGRDSHASVLQQ